MSTRESSQISVSELRDVLNLVNPDTKTFTCVGNAPSQRRRCRNHIAGSNQSIADDIVRNLPRMSQNRSELRRELHELAERALCRRNHQNQASEVAQDWYKAIVQEINRRSPSSTASRRSSPRRTSVAASAISSPRSHLARRDSVVGTQNISLHSEEQHDPDHNTESNDPTSTHEDDACSICYRPFENPCRTPCGHKFCRECISDWLKDHRTCPYDRRSLRVTELITIEPTPSEDTSCVICCEAFVAPCRTPCGHTFCRECISTWLKTSPRGTCPFDRRPLRESDLVSNTG